MTIESNQQMRIRNSKKLLLFCWMAYLFLYLGRKNYSACMSDMIADGVLDKVFGGTVGTGFLLFYAVGQFINGMLGDRFSPKYMISLGLFGAGAMNILMGINSAPALFFIFWCLNGYFCSMLWSSIIRGLSEWCEDSVRIPAGASLSATIPAGSILSYLVCALCLYVAGWRTAFLVCGSILLVESCVFFAGLSSLKAHITDMEQYRRACADDDRLHNMAHGKYSMVFLIFSAGVLYAVIGVVFNGILKDGLDLWVPTYLTDIYIDNASLAAVLITILPIVNLVGVYVAKWLNTRYLHNEMMTCAVLFGISTVALLLLCFITHHALSSGSTGILSAMLSVLLISVTTSAMLGVNTLFLTFIPFHFSRIGRSAAITGFLNSCAYAAAAISGLITGYIATHFNWTITMISFLAISALGILSSLIGAKAWAKGREKVPH